MTSSRQSTEYRPRPKKRTLTFTEPVTLETGSVIFWDRAFRDDSRRHILRVPVRCGNCNRERIVEAAKTSGKSGQRFTGHCVKCRGYMSNLRHGKSTTADMQAGRFVIGGYRCLTVSFLTGRAHEIASQMVARSWGGLPVVREHRLVVALSIGRPLFTSEVVHHRNGDKLDNRLENLEITTHAKHRQLDVKYYDLWQAALARIEELEMKLLRCKEGRD